MMRGIFTLVFCLVVGFAFGQSLNDYRSAVNNGSWNVPGSWERFDGTTWQVAGASPTSAVGVITIRNGFNINHTAGTTAIDQTIIEVGAVLTISAGQINVQAGLGDDLTVNGTVQISNATLRANQNASLIVVNGTVNNAGSITNTTPARLRFNLGAVYNHDNTTPGLIPMAAWNDGSLCRIRADVADTPGALNQSFYDFEWNTPTLSNTTDLAGALSTVRNNLTFTNTGGSRVFLAQGSAVNLTVGNNFTISSGALFAFNADANTGVTVGNDFIYQSTNSGGSYGLGTVNIIADNVLFNGGTFDASGVDIPEGFSGSGNTSFTILGNFTNSGTSIVKTGTATDLTLTFPGSGLHNFTSTFVPTFPVNYVVTGTGDLRIAATSFLAGPGNVNVGVGTTLTLLNTQGTGALRNGTASGAVRLGGTRTYAGTIVYGGSALQSMSSEHPGTANTRINNAANVRLVGDVSFTTGTLDLDNGNLQVLARTLTVESVASNGGAIAVNTNSSLIINGTGVYGNAAANNPTGILALSGTNINNLTINRTSGGLVTKTTNLTIRSNLNLSNGVFALASGTTTVNGNFAVTSGTLTGTSPATLNIAGAGAMPAGVSMTGSLATLTMNRLSTTLNFTNGSGSNLDVTRLNLYNGNVTNAGGLRMANGGSIFRTDGFLTNPIAAVGTYSVQYTTFAAANLLIGFEIPVTVGVLNNFTINNTLLSTRTVQLDRALNARGAIAITRGGLITDNNSINVGRNFTVGAAGSLVPGTSTFTFDGSVTQAYSTPVVYSINNIVVNKTGGNFNINSGVSVETSFAVNSATRVNAGTNRLTLLSTATTTAYVPTLAAGSNIVGSVVVQRHLPNTNGTRAYRYLSSPINTSTVADWQAEFPVTGTFSNPSTGTVEGIPIKPASPSLYYYNEALVTGSAPEGAGYVAYPSSGNSSAATLVSGRGYASFIRNSVPINYDTRGTLQQGNRNVTVTHSGGTNSGYNLVGNPYPAPVDWDLLLPASTNNIDASIYFTDNTQNSGSFNVAYNGVTGVSVPPGYTGNIAQGQGFWVKVSSAGSGIVRFREAHKQPVQTQFLREGEISNLLRIAMKQGTTTDHIAILLKDDATEAFDTLYDAYKFGAFGLTISSLSTDNQRLAINTVSGTGCKTTVPLSIDGGVTGSYTLDFTGMESFETSVQPFLYDKVTGTRVSILTTPVYSFAVTDLATLKDRFYVQFDGPELETALAVSGESTCENNTLAYVTLETSQSNVKYVATLSGTTVSDEVTGNGGTLQIPVNVALLPQGDNEIIVSAKMLACDAQPLLQKATISVVKKGVISSVKDGASCGEGTVGLNATSLDSNLYNWYERVDDTMPIVDQHSGNFTTPVLTKSKTYYVAAVNGSGCEGERVEVKAIVNDIAPAAITAAGTTLSSNYSTGNQWYVDGLVVENGTAQEIEAVVSGIYTVVVSVGECKVTSEGREMVVTGVAETSNSFIKVFPNPATEKVTIEVRSMREDLEARLISATGEQLNMVKLSGTQDSKTGEFNLVSLPNGTYLVRIQDGQKVYTKKILKVK